MASIASTWNLAAAIKFGVDTPTEFLSMKTDKWERRERLNIIYPDGLIAFHPFIFALQKRASALKAKVGIVSKQLLNSGTETSISRVFFFLFLFYGGVEEPSVARGTCGALL